jgi:crossover junction endodeoxyribonuclease RuvC
VFLPGPSSPLTPILIVLGIDPSSTATGYGLVELDSRSCRFLQCGCIRAPSNRTLAERLALIYERLGEVVATAAPHAAAIETSFYGKDPDAASKLGEARGVVRLVLHQAGLEVAHYSPSEVKKAVVGRGQATKEQVQFMVAKLLKLKELPRPLDASDALAVALCHVHQSASQITSAPARRKPEVEALLKRVVRR